MREDGEVRRFYRDALVLLSHSGPAFLLGGAHALSRYTGIQRDTKDLDVFVRPRDVGAVLDLFAEHGYESELHFDYWLGKIHSGEAVIDVVFGSANGVTPVDDLWFQHGVPGEAWGIRVQLAPVEEMVWQKAFIMERLRFDGADIAHMFYHQAVTLDWSRLLARFGDHWPVLLGHLILFGFIYPQDRRRIPRWVMERLLTRALEQVDGAAPADRVCRGTLLSILEYLPDVLGGGHEDGRVRPHGALTADQVTRMTRRFRAEDAPPD